MAYCQWKCSLETVAGSGLFIIMTLIKIMGTSNWIIYAKAVLHRDKPQL